MKTIVRNEGNIGPFDSIEEWPMENPDRLRCYRNGQPEDYAFAVMGEYTLSEDPADAPEPSVPVESLEAAITRINEEFEAEMKAISSQYPPTEREGWKRQEDEARAFLADPLAPTPLLDSLISESGEDKNDIVQNIMDKVAAYSAFYGAALGRKRLKIAQRMQLEQ